MVRRWSVVYRLTERALHPAARTAAPSGGRRLAMPRRHGTVLVVTFRRSGAGVPTPLSCAVHDGRLYASTAPDSGKVKRIHDDPRVLVAPATPRGRPLAPPVEAVARILTPPDTRTAERILEARFGLLRRLYRRAIGVDAGNTAYLEIAPKG